MMTQKELLREVMRGALPIVGDYRGSHAELLATSTEKRDRLFSMFEQHI